MRDAVRLALRENRSIAGADAGALASAARIAQARGGMLPKVNYSESFARSNNPVFVFSSLLTQHQFGVENFAIGPLNRPDFLNNFQSPAHRRSTHLRRRPDPQCREIRRTRPDSSPPKSSACVQMNVIAQTARAYYGAVLAAENLKAAEQALRSAEADLERAEAVRAAGMSTDADVLSIRVHLAASPSSASIAAPISTSPAPSLNDALGLPLDTPHYPDHAARRARPPRSRPRRARKRRLRRPPRSPPDPPGHQPRANPGGCRALRHAPAGQLPRRLRSRPPALHRSRRRQLAGLRLPALEPLQRLRRQGAHRRDRPPA